MAGFTLPVMERQTITAAEPPLDYFEPDAWWKRATLDTLDASRDQVRCRSQKPACRCIHRTVTRPAFPVTDGRFHIACHGEADHHRRRAATRLFRAGCVVEARDARHTRCLARSS